MSQVQKTRRLRMKRKSWPALCVSTATHCWWHRDVAAVELQEDERLLRGYGLKGDNVIRCQVARNHPLARDRGAGTPNLHCWQRGGRSSNSWMCECPDSLVQCTLATPARGWLITLKYGPNPNPGFQARLAFSHRRTHLSKPCRDAETTELLSQFSQGHGNLWPSPAYANKR